MDGRRAGVVPAITSWEKVCNDNLRLCSLILLFCLKAREGSGDGPTGGSALATKALLETSLVEKSSQKWRVVRQVKGK